MKLFARILLALFLFAILASIMGGCQWHRQRMQKKYCKQDTIYAVVRDTIYTKTIEKDSTFVALPGDTVIIYKDRLKITYIRRGGDSSTIYGTCIGDTIYRTKIIKVPTNCPEPPAEKSLLFWKIALILMAILCILAISR